MTLLIIILVLCYAPCVTPQLLRPPYELSEDGRLTFPEIAAKYGHPAKVNYVNTEDGYILTLYRIPGDRQRPVLLVHGNTLTSDCFIQRGKRSLAITLAGKGYDVWAINLRGTTPSQNHVSMDPIEDPERFFNYTFFENGIYDLPATIDFVLKKTGQAQLLVIGYSMGTAALYVMGAEKPEYNEKIKLAISLAPVAYRKYLEGPSSEAVNSLLKYLTRVGVHDFMSNKQWGPIIRTSCLQPLGYEYCIKNNFFLSLGWDEEGFEPEFMKTFLGQWPGGTSRKTLQHLEQLRGRDQFTKFHYGKSGNLREYGTGDPPKFDLSKVTMKSALFVGNKDGQATVADSSRLNASLPNVVYYLLMPYKNFNHADFVWGRNMNDNLYPYLLPLIDKYV